MKTILIACAAMIIISVGAYYGLDLIGWDSATQTSGDAVRLD